MNWYNYVTIAAITSLLLPVIIIVALRLFSIKSFLALLIYYLLAFIVMIQDSFLISVEAKKIMGLSYNLIDTPLILSFLLFFTSSWRLSKQIRTVIFVFIAFELLIITFFGFNKQAITITIGPGILLNLFYCFYFFFRQTKVTVFERKETGKTVMLASLLFAYGCFALIYIFHYLMETPHKQDVYLMFCIVTFISSLIMTAGIWTERKHILESEELNRIPDSKKGSVLQKPASLYKSFLKTEPKVFT